MLTVTEPRFYTHFTTTLALQALAKQRNAEFSAVDLDDFKLRKWPARDVRLIVLHAAHLKIARITIDDLRSRYPHAKIVTLGSDFIYYVRKYPDATNHYGLLVDPQGYEYQSPWQVDLHLDLMQECVDALRRDRVCQSARWYWTASRAGLRIAKKVALERPPKKLFDVICYANPNVSAPGNYRPRLSGTLAGKNRSIQWGGTTEAVTLDYDVLKSIYRLYRQAKVCLGTSSPSWTPCRTMKGWRDWFAPTLGVPLIYDDLPDVTQWAGPAAISEIPLETFPYEDGEALEALLCKYDDAAYAARIAAIQAEWGEAHTIEKQFTRIFDYYGIW